MDIKIDRQLIEHVARVARLELTEKEKQQFEADFREILEAFSKLDEVDVTGVEPQLQPVDLKNALREDEPKECLPQETALSLSKHKKDGYFKGPKVV